MTEVLNPALYQQLCDLDSASKSAGVRIANQGCEGEVDVDRDRRVGPHQEPRLVTCGGEEYVMCCPFCNDGRHRLYVSYLLGMKSPMSEIASPTATTPGQMCRLAYCQNEQKSKPDLWGTLQGGGYEKLATLGLIEVNKAASISAGGVPLPSMGNTRPIHELPIDSPPVQYLINRGYDVQYLGKHCGAVYIASHNNADMDVMVSGRIGFPFYQDGKLVSWQARVAREIPKGSFCPKWYFPKGSKKALWNYDVASKYECCILGEGILSAVNFGPAGMAIGGKTLLQSMVKLIVAKWKYVLVALDPDAGINHRPDEKDWQAALVKQLRKEGVPHVEGIIWTKGDNRDPGDIGPLACAELVRRSFPALYEKLPYYSGGGNGD